MDRERDLEIKGKDEENRRKKRKKGKEEKKRRKGEGKRKPVRDLRGRERKGDRERSAGEKEI